MKTARPTFLQVALLALVSVFALLVPNTAVAAEYWVAPTGSDSAAGTQAAPFASVGRGQTAASAGDTVWIKGGTYAFTGSGTVGVAFTKSGAANNPIKYFAVAGEIPVFDLGNLTPSNRVTGLDVHCNYIHLRGLEVKGVRQYMSGQDSWGVRIQGNNNILENLNVHHNQAPGVFITSGSNNQVLNCDSHHNYDSLEGGGSGDGFGCHSSGGGNVLSGCRGYDNSDDGYDFINAAGSCTVEKSFSFRNGWVPDSNPRTTAGNGAGFKAGGYGSPPVVPSGGAAIHTVRQCVAFDNRSQGFYANHHPGRINFYNNTSFKNPVNYNMLADSGYASSHELRNNIAMASGTAISNLTGGTDTSNSWTLSVTVSTADFISVVEAEALAPRGADGSLPNNSFMRLATGSDLIDKGTNVGLPYSGSAPDLGAFETGIAAGGTPSTGGTTSTGGTATSGGTTTTGGTANGGSGGVNGGASSGGRAASSGGAGTAGTATTLGGALGAGGATTATGGSSGAPGSSGGTGTSFGGATTAQGGAPAQGGGATTLGGSSGTSGGAPSGMLGGSSSTSGGASSNGGLGTTAGSTSGPGTSSPGGCGCRLAGGSSQKDSAALIGALGLALAFFRRRARQAT